MKQFELWLADLNPTFGTETGKIRPVLIIQSNLLNKVQHPSTLICPLTTNLKENSFPLRVRVYQDNTDILKDSDIMIDQIRSIDNRRLVRKIGYLNDATISRVKQSLLYVLDLMD